MPLAQYFWDHEVASASSAGPEWIWDGLIARAAVTLLTSQWKAGKTTLLALLLSRRAGGAAGRTLAGRAVAPGKTVVLSEEPAELWAERVRRYAFGGNVCLFPRPFTGIPTPEQWQELLGQLLELRRAHGIDLAVVDPLAPLVACENSARAMLGVLLPLTALTRAGMGVLILHHPSKGLRAEGQAARGSGALLGHVDVAVEMRHPGGDPATRRRRFLALSRFAATPRRMLLELNAEATDYLPVAEVEVDEFAMYADAFRMVLEDASHRLMRAEILAEWPPDFDRPADSTLKRWLARAVAAAVIAATGTGRKGDPLRYWLPANEARWRATDPLGFLTAEQEADHRRLLAMLAGKSP